MVIVHTHHSGYYSERLGSEDKKPLFTEGDPGTRGVPSTSHLFRVKSWTTGRRSESTAEASSLLLLARRDTVQALEANSDTGRAMITDDWRRRGLNQRLSVLPVSWLTIMPPRVPWEQVLSDSHTTAVAPSE